MLDDATIPLPTINRDPALQVREIDPEYVAYLVEQADAPAGSWPPPPVVRINGTYVAVGGFHRFAAYDEMKHQMAHVRVLREDATWEEARYLASTDNQKEGKGRLTDGAATKAIKLLRSTVAGARLTQREVAKAVGCSRQLVTKVDGATGSRTDNTEPSAAEKASAAWAANPTATVREIAKVAGVGRQTAHETRAAKPRLHAERAVRQARDAAVEARRERRAKEYGIDRGRLETLHNAVWELRARVLMNKQDDPYKLGSSDEVIRLIQELAPCVRDDSASPTARDDSYVTPPAYDELRARVRAAAYLPGVTSEARRQILAALVQTGAAKTTSPVDPVAKGA